MSSPWQLDKQRVRRSFEKAAATYDAAAVLQNEVCNRMLERLALIKRIPSTIIDAGCGSGNALPGLRERCPDATIVELDLALGMLDRARARKLPRKSWFTRHVPPLAVCGDIELLPLKNAAAGMVWSNLALQWVNEPRHAFAEMHRVLEPGGLLMFSTFGPDTLKELRHASDGVDRHTHVHRFIDLHDLGDMLIACGYGDPVMDMETITMTYDDVRALMRDLKAIGARNAAEGRPRGLSAKSVLESIAQRYEAFRRDGKLPATFEVVYGHAWKPMPRVSPSGKRVIDIKAAPAH
jgi:malonyl-CoA O-methyltransferase